MYMSVDQSMNSDVSYIRAYIVPLTSTDHHHLTTSNSHGNYQTILQRRQNLCNSARKPIGNVTTFEQTLTFIEQLKRNQHRSVTEMNRFANQIPKDREMEKKMLTPQELCYQVSQKLEYLIRTRAIEKHRVISHVTALPTTKANKIKLTPRENFNRTAFGYLNQSRDINVISSSTITTNTTVIQDDLVDKDSSGENDETFEEIVEEENLTFIQQDP